MARRVLIVEADKAGREAHRLVVEFLGDTVVVASTSDEAEVHYVAHRPDVVVIAINELDDAGDRFSRRLRQVGATARRVVLRSDDVDVPLDHLTTVLGRTPSLRDLTTAMGPANADRDEVVVGTLVVDGRGQVSIDGTPLHLSPTEYRLITMLAKNVGQVLTKLEILQHVWQYDFGGRTNAVETYVSYLRRKLAPYDGPQIVTIRNKGYMLRP